MHLATFSGCMTKPQESGTTSRLKRSFQRSSTTSALLTAISYAGIKLTADSQLPCLSVTYLQTWRHWRSWQKSHCIHSKAPPPHPPRHILTPALPAASVSVRPSLPEASTSSGAKRLCGSGSYWIVKRTLLLVQ